MRENWITEELCGVDFNDARLNERLASVVESVSESPVSSLPAACGGYAELRGAYRLFNNGKVSLEAILGSHTEATLKRVSQHDMVFAVQDTTEIVLTRPNRQMEGVSHLDAESRYGIYLHVLHVFTAGGLPLGTIHVHHWSRGEIDEGSQAEKNRARKGKPIEEKESYRWLKAAEYVDGLAKRMPSVEFVLMGDSESDIYEVIAGKREASWIIRAGQDRALEGTGDAADARTIRARLLKQPALCKGEVKVSARKPKIADDDRRRKRARDARTAITEVHAAAITLRPPDRAGQKLSPRTVNAVIVIEKNPPAGEEPVEWILLTNKPIESIEQIRDVISHYKLRWLIEIFFRVLKVGCKVEKRYLGTLEAFLPCLAVYMIVAWRTYMVSQLSRDCPDMPCDAVFDGSEWRSVWCVVKRSPPPGTPPTLGDFVGIVAELGGYIKRKDSPPGPQVIWVGMQRMYNYAEGWLAFGPEREKK